MNLPNIPPDENKCPKCYAPCYVHKNWQGLIDGYAYIPPHDPNYPENYISKQAVVDMIEEKMKYYNEYDTCNSNEKYDALECLLFELNKLGGEK